MNTIHGTQRRLLAFAHAHDDMPAFHAAYLVGTFFAAALFNLGFFACLIAMHMCLDYVKYRDIQKLPLGKTIKAILLESLVDITLFSVALAASIYLHHTFALSLVGGLVRSELAIAAIFAIVIPKMEILDHSLAMYVHMNRYMHEKHFTLPRRLTPFQRICIGLTLTAIALLVFSPAFFAHSESNLGFILEKELIPWKL